MNFHQALRYHNRSITIPVYAGQEERWLRGMERMVAVRIRKAQNES